jgi:ribosomal protein S18 acetylase RimI-like enzyme
MLRLQRLCKDIFSVPFKKENMLNFHRINSVNNQFFSDLFTLYTLVFPPLERRTWAALEYELNFEKRFCVHALIQNGEFVGLFNYWTFDRFYYIEHMAISSKFRNQGIGTKAMTIFMEQTKLPIILEVEMPNNIIASRRILFYEKLGFSIVSHNYAQPPYEGSGFLMPELIMTNDIHFANTHFDKIKEVLYTNVYHFEYSKDIKSVADESVNQ